MRHTVRDRQKFSEKLSKTEIDCIALTLYVHLFKYLSSVYSHAVFAILRSKVSMGISVEQYRSRIGFHNHFEKAKDTSSLFKDPVEYDANYVLFTPEPVKFV